MFVIKTYGAELVLLLVVLVNSLFLKKSTWTKKTVRTMNLIFVIGSAACAGIIINNSILKEVLELKDIFKLYFLSAAIYYLSIYSKRFHALERLSVSSLCIGLFLLVSNSDPFIFFMSVSLCMAAAYGLMLTRERPTKDAITMISILVIVAILYSLNAFFSSMIMLLFVVMLCLRTSNKDVESMCVTFILPAIIFVIFRELSTTKTAYLIEGSLAVTGMALMIAAPILLLSKLSMHKNMSKFVVFYIGMIIFMMGTGTIDVKAAAIIMILLLVFIYQPDSNPVTVIGLAMLPPITSFIAKVPLFMAPLRTELLIQMVAVALASTAITIFAGIELYRSHVSKEANKPSPVPIILKIISITVIIVSVIYFDTINTTVECAVKALGK